jgi:YlmC/YmxH family sporulation protein
LRLSDLQTKEIINMTTGKRLGLIIDVIINAEGNIKSLILEEKKMKRLSSREGDDIILVKDKYAE